MSASSSLGTRLTGAARFGTRATVWHEGDERYPEPLQQRYARLLQWFQVQSQSLLVCAGGVDARRWSVVHGAVTMPTQIAEGV